MEINGNHHIPPVNRTSNTDRAERVTPEAKSPVSLEGFHKLEQDLHAVDDVRLDEVERAKSLVGDVNWPPAETIERLSSLLALHVRPDTES